MSNKTSTVKYGILITLYCIQKHTHTHTYIYIYICPLHFWLWGWIKSEVQKRKLDTPDELLARILDAAARIKIGKDQLIRKTRHLPTRVAKCFGDDGGIFENFL